MFSDQTPPAEFPIFPLTGAVLLPHGRLPLTIFEPRYLSMVDAVLAGSRYLGMVQPRRTTTETVADEDPIYEVGGLGRLTSFAEADDGRYVITLSGVKRYRIVEELPMRDGYRRVRARFDEFESATAAGDGTFDRPKFLAALKTYLGNLGVDQSQPLFDHADDQGLVNVVAMTAPFAPEEKQAILECVNLAEQAEMVQSIMTFASMGESAEGPKQKH